ncbi:MAG: PAS domain-containing protein [Parafilimonas terrae]|nr:PAS domain-containing protein [Parafilimonas terrae]
MLDARQPMFTVWGEHQILLYNDQLHPILGGKHPGALGRPFLEVWHEVENDMRPIVEAAYAGTPTQMDDILLMVDRNGFREETHFSFSFTPIRSEHGGIDGFFCACTETTKAFIAARVADAREEERDRFVRLAENSSDFVGMAYKDGRVFYINEAARQLVGLEGADITQLTIADFFPPEQVEIVARDVLPAVVRDGHWMGELSFRHFRTGELIPVLYNVFPITDPSGNTVAYGTVTRDFRERKKAEEALIQSEAKWRGVFEMLHEGFILGELVRDAEGQVADWRYESVNDAWYDLLGITRGTAPDRTIRDVFPGIEDEWVDEVARVVETNTPARFTRRVGTLDRWYDGVAQPIGGDRFTVIFTEVTERIQRDRRQATLLTLADELRGRSNLETIVSAAARCLSDAFEVDRVGFGIVNRDDETIDVRTDWCEPGMESMVGRHAFASFGSHTANLKRDEVVSVDDVHSDPRTSGQSVAFDSVQIRSFIDLPISIAGHLHAVVFAHSRTLHAWTDGELQFLEQVIDRVRVALLRQRVEDAQRVLTQEMAHRMKNSLAMVQAITTQTLRQAETMEAGRVAIASRLSALARAQDILTHTAWEEADVRDVVRAAIEPHSMGGDRITIDGPRHQLNSQQALGLGLAIHELATNAAKYGALSNAAGHVAMSWSQQDGAFTFRWIESDGPPVREPTRKGFGSKLIERIVGSYFDGTGRLDYAPDGVRFELIGSPSPRTA